MINIKTNIINMKFIAETFYIVTFYCRSQITTDCSFKYISVQDLLQQGLGKSNLKEDRISFARGQSDEVCGTQPFLTLLPFNHFIALQLFAASQCQDLSRSLPLTLSPNIVVEGHLHPYHRSILYYQIVCRAYPKV